MPQERMSIEDMRRFLADEARFVAMDKDGDWCWYGIEPTIVGDVWHPEYPYSKLSVLPDIDLPWDESLTEIRPKPRWRAEDNESYWVIYSEGKVVLANESQSMIDDARHIFGNYWQTREQAEAYAEARKALAIKMHAETQA